MKNTHHITLRLVITLIITLTLGCENCEINLTSPENLRSVESSSGSGENKYSHILIEDHQQMITLIYDESFSADSCAVEDLSGVTETTTCTCTSGECSVGLTPTGEESISYTYTVSSGASESAPEIKTAALSSVVPFVSIWKVGAYLTTKRPSFGVSTISTI